MIIIDDLEGGEYFNSLIIKDNGLVKYAEYKESCKSDASRI